MNITLKDSQRFMSKVRLFGVDACWTWIGAIKDNGYGNFYIQGKYVNAHKAAYIFAYGDIVEDFHILHTCDNRACVNPHHLRLGTRQDNMDDMVEKKRSSQGEDRWNAFLSQAQVNEIRSLYDSGKTISEISKSLGLKYGTTYQISKRKRWIEHA